MLHLQTAGPTCLTPFAIENILHQPSVLQEHTRMVMLACQDPERIYHKHLSLYRSAARDLNRVVQMQYRSVP